MELQAIGKSFPTITAIPWVTAKEVLGGEASDFTPWLQQAMNLEVLGAALSLDELTAVATEHNVLGKRLDILARALDEDGEEIPVCIDNQYGMSDASHLGRLIAYLAQQERGRAVWVVEKAHDAFIAGVRFLNRTSTDEVGYYLVEVRFTPAPNGTFYVHYEVLAAPVAGEGAGRSGGTGKTINPEKVDFLNAVLDQLKPQLTTVGFGSMNTHARGNYLWMTWPSELWFAEFTKRRVDARVTQSSAVLALYVNAFATKAANVAGAEVLRVEVEDQLRAAVPPETEIEWDKQGSGLRKVVKFVLPDHGYNTSSPEAVSRWLAACLKAVLTVLRDNPIPDFRERVEQRSPGATLNHDDVLEEDEDV